MNWIRRGSFGGARRNSLGLALLLVTVVLVPSICLLWFMKQAVTNERLAVQQRLAEAYRGYLSLAQERLAAYWRARAGELDAAAAATAPPAVFAEQVLAGSADAVICLDDAGKVVYPNACAPSKPENLPPAWSQAELSERDNPAAAARAFAELAQQATNANLTARALQAQARCLVGAGDKPAALAILIGSLGEERLRNATDPEGRLVAPNALLMALELLKDSGPEQAAPLERLKQRLLDYRDPTLAASQRRFLMHELQRLFPGRSDFPTLAAEDLAARFVEAGPIQIGEAGVRSSSLPGVWRFASASRHTITLHQTDNLLARLRATAAAETLPADATMTFLVPGRDLEGASLTAAAGSELPGWRLALSLNGHPLSNARAEQRIAAYIWIGVLVVALVLALGLLALRLVRRQMEVAQLRNDLVANVTHELKTPLSSMRLLVDTLLNSEKLHEPTAREYLQLIATENARLSRLIDNFLAFSRMERNKRAFDFRAVQPEAIVEGASAAVRERFHAARCQFEVSVPRQLPPIAADADALVTAVVNLLDNAFKYTGEQKEIRLSSGAEEGNVFFKVQDNGMGLSPRETKRIFKRFYQVDQRMSRTGGGCGLGLSIVKFIVTAHQGSVRVDSQPNKGSTFAILIPVLS